MIAQLNKKIIHSPDLVTKELSIYRRGEQRKVRLSSNFLPMFGFESNTRFNVYPVGNHQGMKISFDTQGSNKIHLRKYKNRKNNPFETHLDIQSQEMINQCIPGFTERLHFTLQNGEILVRPLVNKTFHIRKNLKTADNPFQAFVGMTAGVDAHCLERAGFKIDTVLEFRPQEARDKTDLTETGCLSVLANTAPRILLNQDIYSLDWDYTKKLVDLPVMGLAHFSTQCDDFSVAKANSLKKKSVINLDTTRDMFLEVLEGVDALNFATIIIENVPPFSSSVECDLLELRLRRMGYFVEKKVLDARDFGGLTSRKRFYLVASIFPGFTFPSESENSDFQLQDIIDKHISSCRDISHTNSLKLAFETERARIVSKDSKCSPTILKSQLRQTKDSVYIEYDGRYFLPSEALTKELMGIPDDFDLSVVGSTIASEIIGQSIEYPMHEKLVLSVKQHIADNVGHCFVSSVSKR